MSKRESRNRDKNNNRSRDKNRVQRRRQDENRGIPRSTPARRSARRLKKVPVEQLKEEYDYVIKDLRIIFGLAFAMFVLLIVANIVFPMLNA